MSPKKDVKMKEIIVDLPGRELKFMVVEDIEALITDVSDPDQVPCWADIWPAAYGMADYLWDKMSFAPGESVLELGAGMGLPGIVCGVKGARAVLSDFNPTALQMSGENASRNGVQAELLLEDWRTFSCREKFDYLLAADVLYDPLLNPFLGQIFHNNLKPGGTIIISHPRRAATEEFLENWYDASLFTHRRVLREVEVEGMLLPSYRIALDFYQSRQPPS